MILVSFSSAEDALFNDVKKYDTFRSQGTENLPFRFFGTPGITLQLWQLNSTYICEFDLGKVDSVTQFD